MGQLLDELAPENYAPEDAEKQPSQDHRRGDGLDRGGPRDAEKTAGDPGPVPVRRLSNAEYNYTIRDLTRGRSGSHEDFPVDPANEAGFDNSAESSAPRRRS